MKHENCNFLQILATSEWPPPSQNAFAMYCTNTELGKNFYFLGWQKQSKLFLHKAENIKIHLAIIKLLLNYSKMRSIFFPNGNFGPYYLFTSLMRDARPQSWHLSLMKFIIGPHFLGNFESDFEQCVATSSNNGKNCERRKKNQHRIGSNPWSFLVSNP